MILISRCMNLDLLEKYKKSFFLFFYIAWGADHEPDNNAFLGQNCLERLGNNNRYYWNDRQCSDTNRMSACEYELPKNSGKLSNIQNTHSE